MVTAFGPCGEADATAFQFHAVRFLDGTDIVAEHAKLILQYTDVLLQSCVQSGVLTGIQQAECEFPHFRTNGSQTNLNAFAVVRRSQFLLFGVCLRNVTRTRCS